MASKSSLNDGKSLFPEKIFFHQKINISDMSSESVEVLRERLSTMKRLIADKQAAEGSKNRSIDEIFFNKPTRHAGIIDGHFLSIALCGALCVILVVAVYAFYSLYHAVLKKFPSKHDEF